MIKIALIDDHQIVRSGFAQLLNLEPDLRVVAEFGSAAEALAGLPGSGARVCVCDISMPDQSGLDLLKQAIAELLGEDLFVGTLRLPQRFARLRAQFFELGAVQKEEYDEEGVSLLAVRLPRSELNRLVSREGVVPTEFIEQHTLQ